MFDQLFNALAGTMNPFQGFMADLWKVWQTDVGRAVLIARWYWQSLPQELAQQAAMLQQQQQNALESHRIDREVDARLGAMGIFPGSSSSSVRTCRCGIPKRRAQSSATSCWTAG